MRIQRFSTLAGSDFDRFLTSFSKMQDMVRVGPYRTGVLLHPTWIGFICQPTSFAKDFWVIDDDLGRPIGRIGASVSPSRPQEGSIGFFEVDLKHPASAQAGADLLTAAEIWLREQKVRRVLGPMNLNNWYQYRFRLDPARDSDVPLAWEPVQPPEYVEIWKKAGYQLQASDVTRAMDGLAAFVERTRPALTACEKAGMTFLPFDPVRSFSDDFKVAHEISMRGLGDSPLFEPLTLEAFRGLHVSLPGRSNFMLSHLAFDRAGHGVAFQVCFEDSKSVVLWRHAVVPEARGTEVLAALAHLASEKGLAAGLSKYMTSLEPVATAQIAPGETLLWEHHFGLFAKALS